MTGTKRSLVRRTLDYIESWRLSRRMWRNPEWQRQMAESGRLIEHEETLRVLHHLVETYADWRDTSLGMPNEFTDDAVRIARQHLQENNWGQMAKQSEDWP